MILNQNNIWFVKDDCYFHVRQRFLRDMAYKPINI